MRFMPHPAAIAALFLLGWPLLAACTNEAEPPQPRLVVAVASNFKGAFDELAPLFESEQDCVVDSVVSSTGTLFAQIRNGAPFDVFLAADVERPHMLEQQGVSIAGSRFTYAHGKLVLWSRMENYFGSSKNPLASLPANLQHFAIANAKLAPYGRAAEEVLHALHLWENYQQRLVRGGNVSHTFQYVFSGNAEVGLVAYAQVKSPAHTAAGSLWVVPENLYAPIEQQAVLLQDQPYAREFMRFLRSKTAQDVIHSHGYGTP
jgi:molybdate transport system substrate-binding protein